MATPGHRIDVVLARRPAHAAVVALGVGLVLGPMGLRLLRPQLMEDGALIETTSEIVLLTCLFCLGLRLRMPIEWRTWRIPLRLSTLATLATVALAAAAAHLMFDMSLAESLLLGAIIAPTDSVLASDVPSHDAEQDAPSFILCAESGINNGLAAALVLLVLGMMGLSDSDSAALGSISLVALWAAAGGLVVGSLVGTGMARWIKLLDPERQADFLEEAMVFATAALAYGAAVAIHTDGFLAVFTAGVALSHGGQLRRPLRNRPLMPRVLRIAGRIERYCWLVIVVLLGALVTSIEYKWWMLVFAVILILIIRPLAVRLALGGVAMPEAQWRSVAGFTARGTASLYCLAFSINHGLGAPYARLLAGVTLVVVVTSIIASTISGLPLSRPSPGTVDL
ncbi:MAG: sodium/hydrogen exchanger family protein [Gammaproteobacteria bacterium]|nr:sodium/hydrogen exchanger family protein [Gammaproteobacteria bacterium]